MRASHGASGFTEADVGVATTTDISTAPDANTSVFAVVNSPSPATAGGARKKLKKLPAVNTPTATNAASRSQKQKPVAAHAKSGWLFRLSKTAAVASS